MHLIPKDLENMLGTKEEFESGQCKDCDYKEDCKKEFGKLDEDGDDLMEENNRLDLAESQMDDEDLKNEREDNQD
jgi:hypothetical protein